MSLCSGSRVDGGPCRARAARGSDFCFWHDPKRRDDMLEASSRGGTRKTIEIPQEQELTPGTARRILAGVIEAVATGTMEASVGRTIGYLLQIEARIRESHDLERRVEALEDAR